MMDLKPLMTSNSNEWYTPDYLYNYLNDIYKFNLDPCATKESAKCLQYYTKEDDGLSKCWINKNVFVNPPYGRDIKDWVKKSYESSLNNCRVVMLIPARTDTTYWHDFVFKYASKITFLKSRIKFISSEGISNNSATFPSAIIEFDNRKDKQIINTLDLKSLF